MCIYEALVGEMPSEDYCKNGCENCECNVPDISEPEEKQDRLPY